MDRHFTVIPVVEIITEDRRENTFENVNWSLNEKQREFLKNYFSNKEVKISGRISESLHNKAVNIHGIPARIYNYHVDELKLSTSVDYEQDLHRLVKDGLSGFQIDINEDFYFKDCNILGVTNVNNERMEVLVYVVLQNRHQEKHEVLVYIDDKEVAVAEEHSEVEMGWLTNGYEDELTELHRRELEKRGIDTSFLDVEKIEPLPDFMNRPDVQPVVKKNVFTKISATFNRFWVSVLLHLRIK